MRFQIGVEFRYPISSIYAFMITRIASIPSQCLRNPLGSRFVVSRFKIDTANHSVFGGDDTLHISVFKVVLNITESRNALRDVCTVRILC